MPNPRHRRARITTTVTLPLLLTATLALRTAYARNPAHRTAAHRTLHPLLRLAPWYPDRPQ
ncbi:hypothetical protein ACFW2K_38760 [Streptomyces nigra]|uniref:hypothetical protein n=1 Tax=Streptomyces nigra TaxID=1827580 RepID=UPI0036780F84